MKRNYGGYYISENINLFNNIEKILDYKQFTPKEVKKELETESLQNIRTTERYILEIYKNSNKLYEQQLNKKWKMNFSISELSKKKIGFIGTGTLATEAAKRLQGFDVEIWGVNTTGSKREYFDKCFSSEQMDEVFKHCDTIVCTIPATKETIGIINKDKFELMKDDSVFINVGRGNIVNEKDLIKYMNKFRGVALDVFENEPLDKDSELWNFENIIITPHNSWVSDRNDERTFEMIYNN